MSTKMHFLCWHLDYFPDNCGDYNEEQGEKSHQNLYQVEESYQGYWDIFFYLLYLPSIHEKENCIAMFWTVCPHSLGSCYLRSVWATCLPHKVGATR